MDSNGSEEKLNNSNGSQAHPPAGAEGAAAMQQGVPPHRQRVIFSVERPHPIFPLRPAPLVPLTLESLRAEIVGRMDRQDAILRLLLVQAGVEIPDFFRDTGAQSGTEAGAVADQGDSDPHAEDQA